MATQALKDLNVLPITALDKCSKPCMEITGENGQKLQIKSSDSSFSSAPVKEDHVASNGAETASAEVEYIESENLADLSDVDSAVSTLLERLEAKDWVCVCEALNNVRQLSIFHKEKLIEMLGLVIPLVVKSLKNPRSAVCKSAIMTSADIFKAYADLVIDLFEPLLMQLLLKSSQDKRFVCEAAETALIAMTNWISPTLLLPKLLPYLKNRNPRLRAKASMCISKSVPRLGIDGIKEYGMDKLIQIAASQLSDQLPESREAARVLAMELQTIYSKSQVTPTEHSPEMVDSDSWETFCHAKLTPLSAQAILRVTSPAKEGIVLGC